MKILAADKHNLWYATSNGGAFLADDLVFVVKKNIDDPELAAAYGEYNKCVMEITRAMDRVANALDAQERRLSGA